MLLPTLLEVSLKLYEELDGYFHATWSVGFVLIFLKVSTLLVGYLFLRPRCPCTDFVRFFSSFCYLMKGAPKFSDVLILDCELCTVNYSPYILILSSHDKQGLAGRSSLLPDRIYYWFLSFLQFYSGGEFKTEVTRKRL